MGRGNGVVFFALTSGRMPWTGTPWSGLMIIHTTPLLLNLINHTIYINMANFADHLAFVCVRYVLLKMQMGAGAFQWHGATHCKLTFSQYVFIFQEHLYCVDVQSGL